jgi:hypothetical protein
MSQPDPTRSTVRRASLKGKPPVECIIAVKAVCNAGSQSDEV